MKNVPNDDWIGKFLSNFNTRFNKHYAYTITIAQTLPLQVNNEIRNAVSHLARAHEAEDGETRDRQAQKALDHLERASRDCLKVALLKTIENVDKLRSKALHQYGYVPKNLNVTLHELGKDYKQLLLDEAASGSGDIISRYEHLLERYLQLEESINKEYDGISALESAHHRKITFLKAWLIAVSAGLAASLIWHFLPIDG